MKRDVEERKEDLYETVLSYEPLWTLNHSISSPYGADRSKVPEVLRRSGGNRRPFDRLLFES